MWLIVFALGLILEDTFAPFKPPAIEFLRARELPVACPPLTLSLRPFREREEAAPA